MEKKIGEGRGVVVDNPVPNDFGNIRLSKADFVKKQQAKKLKEQKLKEYSKQLDSEKDKKVEEAEKPEIKDSSKEMPVKRGRPKKIE